MSDLGLPTGVIVLTGHLGCQIFSEVCVSIQSANAGDSSGAIAPAKQRNAKKRPDRGVCVLIRDIVGNVVRLRAILIVIASVLFRIRPLVPSFGR